MNKFEEEFEKFKLTAGASPKHKKIINHFKDWQPQQPQQALPVVKDFVDEWYEGHKDDLDFSIFEACVNLHDDCSSDFEKWFGNSENKSIETLIRMKDGYTVEKPQLFYLKNKMTGFYLFRAFGGKYGEQHQLREDEDFKFTQQEIDSMQTGSYEQIEVAE